MSGGRLLPYKSLFTSKVRLNRFLAAAGIASRRGADEFRTFIVEWLDTWADDAHWQLDTARAYGAALMVLARFSGHARASGAETAWGVFQVFRFREGRISRLEQELATA